MISYSRLIGVCDRMTYKPLLVFNMCPETEEERRIMSRAGFGHNDLSFLSYTFFYDLTAGECSYDPFKLSDQRTIGEAARHIKQHGLPSDCTLIDCEYLRGEKDEPMTFSKEFDQYWMA